MRVLGWLALGAAAVVTAGCSVIPGRSSVSGDWSCRAIGESACHSIAHNDITHEPAGGPEGQVVTFAGPTAQGVYGADRPQLYGRHVMRVSIAPWIDEEGRYHAASTIFAPTGAEIWGVPTGHQAE